MQPVACREKHATISKGGKNQASDVTEPTAVAWVLRTSLYEPLVKGLTLFMRKGASNKDLEMLRGRPCFSTNQFRPQLVWLIWQRVTTGHYSNCWAVVKIFRVLWGRRIFGWFGRKDRWTLTNRFHRNGSRSDVLKNSSKSPVLNKLDAV